MKIRTLCLACALALAATGGASARDAVAENLSEANKEGRIWTSFALNPHLNPFEFSIEVEGETATLGGKVDDSIDRELAETLALQVSGVKKVVNNIEVDARAPRYAGDQRSLAAMNHDATITATVKSKLLWNSATDGLAIDVDTLDGKVTLSGSVDNERAKLVAGQLAVNTPGVQTVDNRLRIDSGFKRALSEDPLEDAWISRMVKSSLMYSKHVDGTAIDVETINGVVRLIGSVGSAAEKSLAVELSETVRGVKRVNAAGLVIRA
jgi:osmotically-inducible protein OsmY